MREVLEDLWRKGFIPEFDEFVAKRHTGEQFDETREGVLIPVTEFGNRNYWSQSKYSAEEVEDTHGYVIWSEQSERTNAVLIGTDNSNAPTILTEEESAKRHLTPESIQNVSVIGRNIPETEDSSTNSSETQNSLGCWTDNVGIIPGGGTVAACAACPIPWNGGGLVTP